MALATSVAMARPGASWRDKGFSLIEVAIAMALVSIGALALSSVIAFGTRQLTGSPDQSRAVQRASEAVASVFHARDNGVLTWDQLRNQNGASGQDGGVFLDGARDLKDPGPDGLVNTDDDEHNLLSGSTREIEIRDLSPALRQLRVTVSYPTAAGPRQYSLTTHLSAYAEPTAKDR